MDLENKSPSTVSQSRSVIKNNFGKSMKIDFCKRNFSFQSSLSKYFKNHNTTTNAGRKCFYKPFLYSKGLSKNLKIHFLFECTFCRKLFAHNSNLTRHLRIHSGEKPFQCNLCEKSFTSSSNLVQHLGTHSIKNPFKCGYCKKVFTTSNELTKHIQLHLKEKLENQNLNSSQQVLKLSTSFPVVQHMEQQVQFKVKSCLEDVRHKPDHTYCYDASYQLQDSKEKNIGATNKNKTKCNSNNPSNRPLRPDHTYWSSAKQSNHSNKKMNAKSIKLSHSNQQHHVNLPFCKINPGPDHTYSTGPEHCYRMELVGKAVPYGTCVNYGNWCQSDRDSRTLKPDHTYSIEINSNETKDKSNKDSVIQSVHCSLSASHQLDTVEPDNRYSVKFHTQYNKDYQKTVLELKDVDSCANEPASVVVHCSDFSKPDHTYCHGNSNVSDIEELQTIRSSSSVGTGWSSTPKVRLQSVTKPQDFLDHTYCFGEKTQKVPSEKDTDHTYCSGSNQLQNIICSDNWSANMKLDHTYCLMRTVTHHF